MIDIGDIKPFLELIEKRYGLVFREDRTPHIQEMIRQSMAACQVTGGADYLALIQSREERFLDLIDLLTVNETYFFRESAHFDIAARHIVAQPLQVGPDKPFFRLLSAGCSSGEEAYSLAMTLMELPGAGIQWDFSVLGIDVDLTTIERARAGYYGSYSFRGCSDEQRNQFFLPTGDGKFRVKQAVREKVDFAVVNLCADTYPECMSNMDIVFYRNVSIYFSTYWQQELFRRLANLLKESGLLFVSSTEMLNYHAPAMQLRNTGAYFYYQKQSDVTAAGRIASVTPVKRKPAAAIARKDLRSIADTHLAKQQPVPVRNPGPPALQPARVWSFEEALQLAQAKKYPEALLYLDGLIATRPAHSQAYNLKANILLNQQQAGLAKELCTKVLTWDAFSLEAYLLLGMAARSEGQVNEALIRFKEAVYLQPNCWLAHFHMAELFQQRKEMGLARREYEITINILSGGFLESHGLTYFPTVFQADHFIRLCRYNLQKLAEATTV